MLDILKHENWSIDDESFGTTMLLYKHSRIAEFSKPSLALKFCLFEDNISLDLFGSFFNIGESWRTPRDGPIESWGIQLCEDYLHLNWGNKCKLFRVPWAWQHVDDEWKVLDGDGCWVPKYPNGDYTANADRNICKYPYRYTLENGEVQDVTATCYISTQTWEVRCFPWIKKTRYYLDVDFSSEVGEKTGSWKGGCVGCAYEIDWPNETPEECLRRMEANRKF